MKHFFLPLIIIFSSIITNAQTITLHSELVPLEFFGESKPLTEIHQKPVDWSGKRMEHDNPSLEHPHRNVKPNPNALPKGEDPALQKDYSGTRDLSITILDTLDGLSANIDPSDNCLAVGPNHVVQMANNTNSTLMRIWDKSGNILISSILVEDITNLGDFGDPNIVYDPIEDRFAFLVLSSSGSKLITCISKTGDPTGAWWVYSYTTSGGFPDYPKIASWGNSYFVTTNSNSPTVFALDKSAMNIGQAMGTAQKFTFSNLPTLGFESASPVTFTGTIAPDADAPAIIMRVTDDAWGASIDSDRLELYELKIDWVDASNSTLTGPQYMGILPYNSNLCGFNTLSCIPQPNTTKKLDPLSNILMDKMQYRRFDDHETIVCTHICNADGEGVAGVRWYEVRKSGGGEWHVYQQGTYAPPDGEYRWMSSISINADNTIALGYNISGNDDIYPSGMLTGRNSCDEKGIMSAEETFAGIGKDNQSVNRYGDYNGMVCDPVDGSFWFTVQYNPTSSWDTRVTHFTITPCGVPTSIENVESINSNLQVVPVPAKELVEISITYNANENAALEIVDAAGKIVFETSFAITKGENKTTIDVHTLANGFYFVQLKTNHNILKQKLVVQH